MHPFNRFKVLSGVKSIHTVVQTSPRSSPELLSLCKTEALSPGNTNSPFPLPWPRQPFFFLARDLRVLGISCKWSHTICVFLCLASFTEHDGLKLHPCCSRCQRFLPFYDWIPFHCMEGPHFVSPFIHWWPLKLFPPSANVVQININKFFFNIFFSGCAIVYLITPFLKIASGLVSPQQSCTECASTRRDYSRVAGSRDTEIQWLCQSLDTYCVTLGKLPAPLCLSVLICQKGTMKVGINKIIYAQCKH